MCYGEILGRNMRTSDGLLQIGGCLCWQIVMLYHADHGDHMKVLPLGYYFWSLCNGGGGGGRCRMSIIRKGNVTLSDLRKPHVALSNLRKIPVTCL